MLVVTGGSKGVGRAIIEKFAAQGYKTIVTCARQEKELALAAQQLAANYGTQLLCCTADLAERADQKKFVDFVLAQNQRIEVLVNNAGFFQQGQLHNEPEGILEKTINTNLYSAYYITKGLIDEFLAVQQGHIFNICSVASLAPLPNCGSYCISKFALYGMSQVLREELKPHNIKVTSVLLGATLTDSWKGVAIAPERLVNPQDVAEAIWGAYSLSGRTVIEELLIRPQLGDL
jgi:short-subunit dehydrogenase